MIQKHPTFQFPPANFASLDCLGPLRHTKHFVVLENLWFYLHFELYSKVQIRQKTTNDTDSAFLLSAREVCKLIESAVCSGIQGKNMSKATQSSANSHHPTKQLWKTPQNPLVEQKVFLALLWDARKTRFAAQSELCTALKVDYLTLQNFRSAQYPKFPTVCELSLRP